MVQIRNMPEDLHRKLKARAALAGMSLSEYLLDEVRRSAAKPSREELLALLRGLPPVRLKKSPARMLREERAKRERVLIRRSSR
jgi:plasmid stability protein